VFGSKLVLAAAAGSDDTGLDEKHCARQSGILKGGIGRYRNIGECGEVSVRAKVIIG